MNKPPSGVDGGSGTTGARTASVPHPADLAAPPRLTDREQFIAFESWEIGRAYGHEEIARAAEDVLRAQGKRRPWRSREQRIAADVAEMERHAAIGHARRGTREWRGTENGDRVAPW